MIVEFSPSSPSVWQCWPPALPSFAAFPSFQTLPRAALQPDRRQVPTCMRKEGREGQRERWRETEGGERGGGAREGRERGKGRREGGREGGREEHRVGKGRDTKNKQNQVFN